MPYAGTVRACAPAEVVVVGFSESAMRQLARFLAGRMGAVRRSGTGISRIPFWPSCSERMPTRFPIGARGVLRRRMGLRRPCRQGTMVR